MCFEIPLRTEYRKRRVEAGVKIKLCVIWPLQHGGIIKREFASPSLPFFSPSSGEKKEKEKNLIKGQVKNEGTIFTGVASWGERECC